MNSYGYCLGTTAMPKRFSIRTIFKDVTKNTWAIELKATCEAIGTMGYEPSCKCDLPSREGEPHTGY